MIRSSCLKKLVFIFLFSLFECDISTSKHGLHEQIVAANNQEPHDVLGMPVSLKASKGGAASSPHLGARSYVRTPCGSRATEK
jgi:hypothetical protein